MSEYRIWSWPITSYGNGFTGYDILNNVIPDRRVEAKNAAELAPHFDRFVKDCASTGKPFFASVSPGRGRGFRKFAGFDRATDKGGQFHVHGNTDKVSDDILA